MPDRDQFGPRLRRERERRRITLDEVAEATRVSVDLFEAMENNDFSRWPSGIFARAFVRDYARYLGLDADAVVDEFCRHFPHGDRRASRLLHAQAELLGHPYDLPADADPLPAGRDRRAPPSPAPAPGPAFVRYAPRTAAAAIDAACVCAAAILTSKAVGIGFWTALGAAAVTYQTSATLVGGGSPGTRVIDVFKRTGRRIQGYTAAEESGS